MVKLIALYRKPENVAEFEQKYLETHLPLVRQVPGLRRVELDRVTGAPRGEPEFYFIAALVFDDRASMDLALASPENAAAGKNLMSFARGLVTFAYAEEVDA